MEGRVAYGQVSDDVKKPQKELKDIKGKQRGRGRMGMVKENARKRKKNEEGET